MDDLGGGDEATPAFLLDVEVKIDAGIANPWETYYAELASREAAAWGLVLLARTRPPSRELPDTRTHPHWAGVALWHHVIAELHVVMPDDPLLRSIWPSLLTVLSDVNDLGARPITIDDLRGGSTKRLLGLLVQTAENTVQVEAKEALRRRPADTRARRVRVRAATNRRKANPRLDLITRDYARPAISLELAVIDGQLQIISRVVPIRLKAWPLKVAKSQQSAVARLRRRGFKPEGAGEHTRIAPLDEVAGDLRDSIADAMAAEACEAIGTGILDFDA